MQYEFVLKEKIAISQPYEQLGKLIVKERDFNNQLKSYQKYIEFRKKRYPGSDHIILINLLDDNGEFIEVVQ